MNVSNSTPVANQSVPIRAARKWTVWRVLRWVVCIYLMAQAVWLAILYIDRQMTFARNGKMLIEVINETDRLDPRWRWEEMQADCPAIPPEQNSAIVLARIREFLPDDGKDRLGVKRADGSEFFTDIPENQLPGEEDGRLLAKLLEDQREAVRLARPLAEMPRGQHDVQIEDNPLHTRIPHTYGTRSVCRLLALEAESHLLNGDSREALRCVRGILHAGASLRDDPSLISQLVRIAGRSMAVKTVGRVLALSEPTAGLAELQEQLDRERKEDLMRVAIRGERAFQHRLYCNIESDKLPLFDAMDVDGPRRKKGTLDGFHAWRYQPHVPFNHAITLQICNRALEANGRPWHERLGAMERIPLAAGQVDLNRIELPAYEREIVLVQMFFPPLIKTVESAARDQARLRCAMVAVACERYRIRQNHWPHALEEIPRDLLAELPTDPYDGLPLRRKQTDDGLIVYSVGPNLLDNRGNLKDHAMAGDDADIGFRLWNTNKRRLPAKNE